MVVHVEGMAVKVLPSLSQKSLQSLLLDDYKDFWLRQGSIWQAYIKQLAEARSEKLAAAVPYERTVDLIVLQCPLIRCNCSKLLWSGFSESLQPGRGQSLPCFSVLRKQSAGITNFTSKHVNLESPMAH